MASIRPMSAFPLMTARRLLKSWASRRRRLTNGFQLLGLAQFFLCAVEGSLVRTRIQRAAAMVGEGLQGFEASLIVGVGCVALNGKDADDGCAVADRDKHDRGGRTAGVSEGLSLRQHSCWVVFEHQLATFLEGPSHQWRRQTIDAIPNAFGPPPIYQILMNDRRENARVRRVEVQSRKHRNRATGRRYRR